MPLPSTILYPSASGGGGAGDVVGPGSSTDNAIARFDSTTGKQLQNSALTVADTTGMISGPSGMGLTGSEMILSTSDQVDFYSGGSPYYRFYLATGPYLVSSSAGTFCWTNALANGSPDTGLARSAAGVVKVTDGSTGLGKIVGSGAAGTGVFMMGGTGAGNYGLGLDGAGNPAIINGAASIIGTLRVTGLTFDTAYPRLNGTSDYFTFLSGASAPAYVFFARAIEASTAGSGAPNVLLAVESFRVLTNEGSTATNYHTLPTAVAGYVFTFCVQDADGLRVTAAAADTIRVIDKVTAAAGYIESTTIGSTVTLVAINATEWFATSINGVWTDGTWSYDDTSLTTP